MPESIIYLGTPEFAVPPLQMLAADHSYRIAAVLTQPDKPAGRGQKLQPSPVKVAAQSLGLNVLQPKSLKNLTHKGELIEGGELGDALAKLGPLKAAVVVAYGKLIPEALLSYPEFGAINIHPSLLPLWRGAAPLQRAIFSGAKKSGNCIMQLDSGLDTGPVFACEECSICPTDNTKDLHDKLSTLSTSLLKTSLPLILAGKLKSTPQPEGGHSYAEKWSNEDSTINWQESAETTSLRVRASAPRPGARTTLNGEMVKIIEALPCSNLNYSPEEPGSIVELNKAELIVQCGESSFLSIDKIQFPGKKPISIADSINGGYIKKSFRFKSNSH